MATIQEIWNNAKQNNKFWDQKVVNNFKQFTTLDNATFKDLLDNYNCFGIVSQTVIDCFGDSIQRKFIDKGCKLAFLSFTQKIVENGISIEAEVLGFHCIPRNKNVAFFATMR